LPVRVNRGRARATAPLYCAAVAVGRQAHRY
jgi:hypothetical protein